jgi:hypothetical protein
VSATSARVPEWIILADGRRVPFEDDAICQALFATTEELGRPDAFLARELADAVVHFVAQEAGAEAPTTAHVAELIVKVVRELGEPALAHAFAERQRRRPASPVTEGSRSSFSLDGSPHEVARRCLREYALRVVFSPDLAAAVRDGLLNLGGLEAPAALAAAVVEGPAAAPDLARLLRNWHEAFGAAGQTLIVDSPEWLAAAYQGQLAPEGLCRALLDAPGLLQRPMIVNVACAELPAWGQARAAGPLFPAPPSGNEVSHANQFLKTLLTLWPVDSAPAMRRLDWHVSAAALNAPSELLRTALNLALQEEAIAFVFDRPRRPLALAEGADRQHPAVLQEVGLNLATFLKRPGIDGDGTRFLEKLPSLARMAVSAGAQKRKFLRRQAEGTGLARGFLLDRARLAVFPLGLDSVVRTLTGKGAASSPLALDCALRIVEVLVASLTQAGRLAHLETGLESENEAADPAQPALPQLQAAARVQTLTGRGTAWVRFPRDAEPTGESLLELLRYAGKRTDIVRLRFAFDR